MKKALITGSQGQDGYFLSRYLVSLGYEVWGGVRRWPDTHQDELVPGVTYVYCDVQDGQSIDVALRKSMPDEIYNLAGQVFVPTSWEHPEETFDVNAVGFLRLMQSVKKICPEARVYQASTSEMFGNTGGFLDETSPMNPTSPYGIAKFAAHKTVRMYREMGMYVCAGILHNHESSKRGREMVTRKITSHVATWMLPDKDEWRTLQLGNMQAVRDWGFAGDYVKAMHLMLQQDRPDDYVVASGETHTIDQFWAEAVAAAGVSTEDALAFTKVNKNLMRVNDTMHLWGNAEKARRVLGWVPEVSFKELVTMMVQSDYELLLQRRGANVEICGGAGALP